MGLCIVCTSSLRYFSPKSLSFEKWILETRVNDNKQSKYSHMSETKSKTNCIISFVKKMIPTTEYSGVHNYLVEYQR